MNPLKDVDRDRLRKAMQASRDATHGDRERFTRLVKKVANAGGTKRKGRQEDLQRPIMLLRQSLRTFKAQLSGGEVRFACEDEETGRDRFAKIQEAHLNKIAREIKLSKTLATAVISSFFKEGVVELHMAEASPLAMSTNDWIVPGRPFVSNVPWVDYGEDMTATHPSKRQFQYHFFDVSFDALQRVPGFNKKVVSKIKLDEKNGYFFDRKETEEPRTAFGFIPQKERLAFDMVRLVAVYIPHLRTRFFWPYRMDTPPLAEIPITDPEGPYRKLCLDEIPDNVMACSQAESLEHLDDLHNSSWRKIASMIGATRDLILYEEGEQEAAENIRTAQHGKVIKVRNADGIRKESFGGVSQNLASASVLTSEWYDRMDDGLKSRAGLGGSASTATEAGILAQSSGNMMTSNLQTVLEFYSAVGNGLRCMMWDDDMYNADTTYEHEELPGYTIPAPWRPGFRMGEREHYNCRVVPYTIRFESPEQKASKLLGTIERLAPLLPTFAQQGRAIDPDAMLEILADAGQPEIRKLFQITDPVEPPTGGERPLQSPNTTRTQIRKSEANANPMQNIVAGMGVEK